MRGHWESETRKLNKHYQSADNRQLVVYEGTENSDYITIYNYHFFNVHGASYTDYGIFNAKNPIIVSPGRYMLNWDLKTDGIDCGITFIEQIGRTKPNDYLTAYPVEAIFANNNTWVYGRNARGRITGIDAPLWEHPGAYVESIIPGSVYTSDPEWPYDPVTFYYSASAGSIPIDFSYLTEETRAYDGNTERMLYIRGYMRSDRTQDTYTRNRMWGRIWLTEI